MRTTKIVLLFSIIASLMIFSGCGDKANTSLQTNTIIQKKPYDEISKTGTLKALGIDLGQKGSHILQEKDGSVTLLHSNVVNLNDEKYLNKEVKINGTLIQGDKGQKDVISVEKIEALEKGTAMKLYTDTELGFKVQYDPSLNISKSQSRVAFKSLDEPNQTIVISVVTLPEEMTFENYLNDIRKVTTKDKKEKRVGKEKLLGYQFTNADDTLLDVYVLNEKYVFNFSHLSQSEDTKDQYRFLFEKMLDSFEVTMRNISSSAEQKTEEDKKTTEEAEVKNTSTSEEINEKPSQQDEEKTTQEQETTEKEAEEPSVPETKPVEEEKIDESDLNMNHEKMISYLRSNINTIAPEASPTGGTWGPSRYEFVDPNYVYVEYNDTQTSRKLLLSYNIEGDTVTTSQIGYFKPGETKDWDTVSTSDEKTLKAIALSEREIYSDGSSGTITKEISILEGYRYFESSRYGFKIQFPANWYYSGGSGNYNFADQPVEGDNILIRLQIIEQSLSSLNPSGSSREINGRTMVETQEDGKTVIYVSGENRTYKIVSENYGAIAKTMSETIVDKE